MNREKPCPPAKQHQHLCQCQNKLTALCGCYLPHYCQVLRNSITDQMLSMHQLLLHSWSGTEELQSKNLKQVR